MATTKKNPASKAPAKKDVSAQPLMTAEAVSNIMMKTDLKNFKDGNFVMVVDATDGEIITTDWLPEMTDRQAQLQFELLYDDLVFTLLDDELSGCVFLLMRASIGQGRTISFVNIKALRRDQDEIDPKIITAIRKAVTTDPLLVFKRGTGFIDITAKAVTEKKPATKAASTKAGATVKTVGTEKVAVAKRGPVKKAAAKAPAVKKTAPAKKAPAKPAVQKTAPAKKAPAKKAAAVKRTAPVKKTAAA